MRLHRPATRTTSHGTIRFRGRLLGRASSRGVQVALYAVDRRDGAACRSRSSRADSTGRFGFKYRFVRTFAPFTYRFQARVDAQPGYPYAAGTSRVVTVRIVR